MNKVLIKAMAVDTPIGNTPEELLKELSLEKSAIKTVRDVQPSSLFGRFEAKTHRNITGSVFNRTFGTDQEEEFQFEKIDLTFEELMNKDKSDFHDVDLIVGTSLGGTEKFTQKLMYPQEYKDMKIENTLCDTYAKHIANKYGIQGRVITLSTACASSANAMSYGFNLIKEGYSKKVVVAGIDFLSYISYFGFTGLHSIDESGTKPFSTNRKGISLGESVGFILLEGSDSLQGNDIEIAGSSIRDDAYHITSPNPAGVEECRALKKCLRAANCQGTSEFGYVNAHGTGTVRNDDMEKKAIMNGLKGMNYYVSSTKSYHGHTLGAAGLLESIITVMVLKKGVIPPTLLLNMNKKNYPSHTLNKKVSWGMSNSFAFGGNVAVLIFKRGDFK